MNQERPIRVGLKLSDFETAAQQGGEHEEAAGGGTGLPTLWSVTEGQPAVNNDLWCDALGLAIVGAVVGRSRYLETPEGQLVHAGLHVVVSTRDEYMAQSALSQIIQPLKVDQAKRLETLARADCGVQQELLDRLKAQYRQYRKTDILPDPAHLAYFTRRIAQLENALNPFTLMENPLPGRLTLASQRSVHSPILAIYEDRAFGGLLDAVRTSRAKLDLELLTKAWRQQQFDGAYLEGIQHEPIGTANISTISLVQAETAERLLVSLEPVIASFADCCWFLNAAQPLSPSQTGVTQPMVWRRLISRLRNADSRDGSIVRMSKEGIEASALFRDRIANILRQERTIDTGFLGQLPRHVSKIGLHLHLAQSEITNLTRAQVEQAIGFSEVSSRQRRAILHAAHGIRAEREFQHLAERVMAKIGVLGPIGFRDLCHTFDDQRSALLLPAVNHLLQTDRILKLADGRFDIPDRWLKRLRVEVC